MSLLVMEMNINYFILKLHEFSIPALAKWILSVCLNIHTMRVDILKESNDFFNEIARLKELKKLEVKADKASDLKEVILIVF